MKKNVNLVCPYCTKSIQHSAAVCPACGSKLPEQFSPPGAPPLSPATEQLSPKSSTETSMLNAQAVEEQLPLWKSAWLLLIRPSQATFRRIGKAKVVPAVNRLFWIIGASILALLVVAMVEYSKISGIFNFNLSFTAFFILAGTLLIVFLNYYNGIVIHLFGKIAKHDLSPQQILTVLGRITLSGLLLLVALEILRLFLVFVSKEGFLRDVRDLMIYLTILYWTAISLATLKSVARYNSWQTALLSLMILAAPIILLVVLFFVALISPSVGNIFESTGFIIHSALM
jgi:hypothetical protein